MERIQSNETNPKRDNLNFDIRVGHRGSDRFEFNDSLKLYVRRGSVFVSTKIPDPVVKADIEMLLANIIMDIKTYFDPLNASEKDAWDVDVKSIGGDRYYILKYPHRHIHNSNRDTCVIIFSVMEWRRCKAFFTLQTSNVGSSVVVYFVDLDMLPKGGGSGPACDNAFVNHSAFKNRLDTTVDIFKKTMNLRMEEIKKHHTYHEKTSCIIRIIKKIAEAQLVNLIPVKYFLDGFDAKTPYRIGI